jgi:hypothetical protein
MRKSLKKYRKPIGTIFRHTVNKISPKSEQLILEAITNIKKNVPESLKKTVKEVSQEASNVQQRNPLDKYDTSDTKTPLDTFDRKTPLSPFFSLDTKILPVFQINNQMVYPHQLDKQALSKVLPMFKFDQAALSKVSSILPQPIRQVQQTNSDGGSILRNKKNGHLKSKSRFTNFNKSRRPYF